MTDAAAPWRVRDVAVVIETPVFRLMRESCTIDALGASLDYYVVQAPDWVNVVAVTEALDLVLVEQYRHARRVMSLEIPAGGCGKGESAEIAGVRELLEETGFTGPATHLRSRSSNPALISNELHTVLVYPVAEVSRAAGDAFESTRTTLVPARQWLDPQFPFSMEHAYSALAVGDVHQLLGIRRTSTTDEVGESLRRLTARTEG